MAITAMRTPDERFDDLPGYAFEPHYLDDFEGDDMAGLRAHYLDEGPRDAEHTFLCLHGQPSWSYLYRKMIPVFTAAGHRSIAPDFFGFGRSDKPTDDAVYTFTFHRNMLVQLIQRLDLTNITLVCQDWGGVIGLTLPMEMPERFSRLLIMNTALATGMHKPGKGFREWQQYVRDNPDFSLTKLMTRAIPDLTEAEAAAYEAPYPDVSYRGGIRTFPLIVPTDPSMDGAKLSQRAGAFWASQWQGQTHMVIGKNDPVLGEPVMRLLQRIIRNCPEPVVLEDAGHFVQEAGAQVAEGALAAFAASE